MKESYKIVPRQSLFVYLDGEIVVKPMKLSRVKKNKNVSSLVWIICPLRIFCIDMQLIVGWPGFACSECPINRLQKKGEDFLSIKKRLLVKFPNYSSRSIAIRDNVIKEGFSIKVPEKLIQDIKTKVTKFTAAHPMFIMRVSGVIKPLLKTLSLEEAVKNVLDARKEYKKSRVRLYIKIGEKYAEIIY